MKYNFRSIEKKWQKYWADNNTYQTGIDLEKSFYKNLKNKTKRDKKRHLSNKKINN